MTRGALVRRWITRTFSGRAIVLGAFLKGAKEVMANPDPAIEYVKARIREEIATANNSSEAGQQVLLENDPQVLKAIDAIPEARKLLEQNQARL